MRDRSSSDDDVRTPPVRMLPDLLGKVESPGLPVLGDLAGILRGLLVGNTPLGLLGVAMFPHPAYLLRRTALGWAMKAGGKLYGIPVQL